MNSILERKSKIFEIKNNVENKASSLYVHTKINNNIMDENTVSIVMTASNRSKQTYFTLKTINDSLHKNIQVIIVDDSTTDGINAEFLQKKYSFNIELIKIRRENKNWHNPLVNYNIGFTFIKGGKVIIQNAEVCHIGDVISYVNKNLISNNYYSFDVKASASFSNNEIIYYSNTRNVDIYEKNIYNSWYQSKDCNRHFHFLIAMQRDTFNIIKGFSYDYAFGAGYDDDDFVLKARSHGITLNNVFHDVYNLGGIHLFHAPAVYTWDKDVESNMELFSNKKKYYSEKGEYIDITENIEEFDEKYNKIYNI